MDMDALSSEITALRGLMRERLGIGGPTLARQVDKAGRMLPRRVRGAARALAVAEPQLSHPKLARRLDGGALSKDAETLSAYLKGVDAADRRVGVLLHRVGGMAFNLLVIVLLLLAVLRWRGLA
ncbi:MAG: hypothetical protein CSA72_01585 [Rhodobacterales bacterium]|nr:MAG: hypothetical protein CSA72_01585 [Rhodobacterales bacterium]